MGEKKNEGWGEQPGAVLSLEEPSLLPENQNGVLVPQLVCESVPITEAAQ